MNAFAVNMPMNQIKLFPTPYNEAERKVIKSGIRFYMEHCPKISYNITSTYFSKYQLLFWSGEHILLKQQESSGLIEKDGILFKVIWNQKQQLTRGKVLSAEKKQYSLSFRVALPEYELTPVVFISESQS